jgi:hypothetical protein
MVSFKCLEKIKMYNREEKIGFSSLKNHVFMIYKIVSMTTFNIEMGDSFFGD